MSQAAPIAPPSIPLVDERLSMSPWLFLCGLALLALIFLWASRR